MTQGHDVVASAALSAALRRAQSGEVRFDPAGRHLYAGDASHFRIVPRGVVTPRTVDDVMATVATCATHDAPITVRGAGTSLAGNAIGPGVVVDLSRHLTRIIDVDPDARRARVEAGVVLDDLRTVANGHGLTFGPDPSTADRCTIGGMVGNNACGAHSLTAGRTSDNVHRLDLVLADGTRLDTASPSRLDGPLQAVGLRVADEVARRHPPIPRRVSGQNLGDLHPDHYDLASFLVGTEGTLGLVVEAELALVGWFPHRAVVALGYPSPGDAADHVPSLLPTGPIALEGMDEHVVAGARSRGAAGTGLLPEGRTWLLVEFDGATRHLAVARAEACLAVASADGVPGVVVVDATAQAALWRVRSEGLGAVTFVPGEAARVAGWEDAAVDPARLGDYLRAFHDLADASGFDVALYGHFGDGCVHTKIGFDHATDAGIAAFRSFVEAAADLTVAHGGSLSGEHGDGRSRSELLERMLGPTLVAAQREVKALFDPRGLLNPGVVIDPDPLDGALRSAGTAVGARLAMVSFDGEVEPERGPRPTWFSYPDDQGDFAVAVNRCIGMGACRRDDDHGIMCPSFRVTGDEQHSTRGRARLLQEAIRADTAEVFSLDDPAVGEALDLCLSCKGCATDCPVDVDVATYKAEFNAHRWADGGRPLRKTLLGRTADGLRWAGVAPGLVNVAAQSRAGRLVARRLGIAPARAMPRLATTTFLDWWEERGGARVAGPDVLLFVDTFSDTLAPDVLVATVLVLEAAGRHVVLPPRTVCCGRPLVDPGMLDRARRVLGDTIEVLDAFAVRGIPIVAVEPSCASALVDEAVGLLDSQAARRVAAAVRTLAGFLVEVQWTPPRLERDAVVHGHCHQHATLRLDGEAKLLDAMGLRWRDLDAGCCGLAGGFGFEAGDPYDVSVAVGESRLLPAVRAVSSGTLVLADGWSCRTQLDHLGSGRRPWHLARLLAAALDGEVADDEPPPARSARLGRRDRRTLTLVALVASGAAILAAGRMHGRRRAPTSGG